MTQEELDKIVNDILNEDVDLDELTKKENEEIEQELKKLEDDIELDDFGKYTEEEYQKLQDSLSWIKTLKKLQI